MIWCSITAATMELFTSVLGKTAQPKSSDYVGASCDLLSFLSNIFARRQYTYHEPLRTIHTHRVCESIYLRVAFPLGKFTFCQTRHSRVTFQHSLGRVAINWLVPPAHSDYFDTTRLRFSCLWSQTSNEHQTTWSYLNARASGQPIDTQPPICRIRLLPLRRSYPSRSLSQKAVLLLHWPNLLQEQWQRCQVAFIQQRSHPQKLLQRRVSCGNLWESTEEADIDRTCGHQRNLTTCRTYLGQS